jgi:trans-o-hydroxybenzylidenepyruvate hydratase-aldolase
MAKQRLTADDVHGAWVILTTPATPGASDWRAENTVDLDETARAVEALVQSGVDGILSLGTYGECATLSWDEKRAFMSTVVDTVAGRVPFFGGTTSLSTRRSIRETREAMDLGVDGVLLGLPMWCKADLPTAVQFYKDVAEACPDAAISIYANQEAFKFEFGRPFWAQVAQIPQVVSAKYLGIGFLAADLRLTKGRIRFLPTEGNYYSTARVDPEQCTAFWTGGALCGPAPALRLRDEVKKAKETGDWSAAKEVSEAIQRSFATLFPHGDFAEFSKYNIGLEKARVDAGGWMKAGPCRAPYHVVPEEFLAGARTAGKLWAELHASYQREPART